MDIVFIRELVVEATIGAYRWERQLAQRLVLDLDLGWDTSKPAADDQLTQALDYAAVCKAVSDAVQQSEFQLLETLAEHLASMLREQFQVPWLRLSIGKPGAVGGARSVGVIIERGDRSA